MALSPSTSSRTNKSNQKVAKSLKEILILSDRSESFWADLFKLRSCLEDLDCALFEKEQCQIRFCLFKFQQLQNKALSLLNHTFKKYCIEFTNL